MITHIAVIWGILNSDSTLILLGKRLGIEHFRPESGALVENMDSISHRDALDGVG